MLAVAPELLVGEGPGAVTHQRVAQQAGVGRATGYRHWPQPEQLLLDVMSGADLPLSMIRRRRSGRGCIDSFGRWPTSSPYPRWPASR
jgi:AcrR family transcriptional regulator